MPGEDGGILSALRQRRDDQVPREFIHADGLMTAVRNAPPMKAGLTAYLWPLLIALFSALLPGEHLRMHHVLGGVLGLAGAAHRPTLPRRIFYFPGPIPRRASSRFERLGEVLAEKCDRPLPRQLCRRLVVTGGGVVVESVSGIRVSILLVDHAV